MVLRRRVVRRGEGRRRITYGTNAVLNNRTLVIYKTTRVQIQNQNTEVSRYPEFRITRPRMLRFIDRTNSIWKIGYPVIQKIKDSPLLSGHQDLR